MLEAVDDAGFEAELITDRRYSLPPPADEARGFPSFAGQGVAQLHVVALQLIACAYDIRAPRRSALGRMGVFELSSAAPYTSGSTDQFWNRVCKSQCWQEHVRA